MKCLVCLYKILVSNLVAVIVKKNPQTQAKIHIILYDRNLFFG